MTRNVVYFAFLSPGFIARWKPSFSKLLLGILAHREGMDQILLSVRATSCHEEQSNILLNLPLCCI